MQAPGLHGQDELNNVAIQPVIYRIWICWRLRVDNAEIPPKSGVASVLCPVLRLGFFSVIQASRWYMCALRASSQPKIKATFFEFTTFQLQLCSKSTMTKLVSRTFAQASCANSGHKQICWPSRTTAMKIQKHIENMCCHLGNS